MSSAPDILTQILALPTDERARFALALIRSLDDEVDAGAAEAWDAEIERRAAAVAAGSASTMTHEEYRDHVRQRRAARGARSPR